MSSAAAIIAAQVMSEHKKTKKEIKSEFHEKPRRPKIRKSAQKKPKNKPEAATASGDISPKKSAISRPEAKPAPITVPTKREEILNARLTLKTYALPSPKIREARGRAKMCAANA
jgi:hypothetical protein